MPRFPVPFYRSARKCWFVQLGKKQIRLHPDETEARRLYHELMAAHSQLKTTTEYHLPVDAITVAEVFDKFLVWTKKHRAERTFQWYQDHLQSFLDHASEAARKPATALKPFMVVEWADAHPKWGSSYRRGAIVALQRPFNWATELGYIEANPIRKIEKPSPTRRENAVSPVDWDKIKTHYPAGDPFLELLVFSWETGCRPQESKRTEARHVQIPRQRIVFPPNEAKGKKRTRVIHLTPAALQIVSRLVSAYPKGPLFRNEDGKPWTAQAMSCRFGRLKKHLGIKFSAYDFRHGFAERLLESGADHLTVAELLGHADGKMLSTVYSHLSKAESHLRQTLTLASVSAGA
jgi:integrase